jgi:hypothetical protein
MIGVYVFKSTMCVLLIIIYHEVIKFVQNFLQSIRHHTNNNAMCLFYSSSVCGEKGL